MLTDLTCEAVGPIHHPYTTCLERSQDWHVKRGARSLPIPAKWVHIHFRLILLLFVINVVQRKWAGLGTTRQNKIWNFNLCLFLKIIKKRCGMRTFVLVFSCLPWSPGGLGALALPLGCLISVPVHRGCVLCPRRGCVEDPGCCCLGHSITDALLATWWGQQTQQWPFVFSSIKPLAMSLTRKFKGFSLQVKSDF